MTSAGLGSTATRPSPSCGASTVTFSYRPLSFTAGWVVSLLALAGVVTTGALGWRGRRRRRT